MFRLWGKIWKDNHLVKDTVYKNAEDVNRTRKVFDGLETIYRQFDLPVPIWLDLNINDFKRHSRTRFRKDNFIESIDFDYLEIQIIEE